MRVTIKYFASIREVVGMDAETIETDSMTVGELRRHLISRGEPYSVVFSEGKSVRFALNQIMCDQSGPLSDSCEVAFFPPVTGG
jgi:sulfur-carrier protein